MQALKHCVSVAPEIRKPIAVERISRTTILRSNEGVWTGWLVRDGAGSFQMFLEFVGWMPGAALKTGPCEVPLNAPEALVCNYKMTWEGFL